MEQNIPQNPPVQPSTVSPVVPIQTPPSIPIPGRAWYRFWATVIDGIYISCISLFILILFSFVIYGDSLNIISSLISVIIYFIYIVYLTANYGKTYGKDAYGLRIVKFNTSENISYGQAIIRELVRVGVLLIPVIGVIFYTINGLVIVFSSDKRGFHDKAANTQVLKVAPAWNLKKQLLFILLPLIIYFILVIILGASIYFKMKSHYAI